LVTVKALTSKRLSGINQSRFALKLSEQLADLGSASVR